MLRRLPFFAFIIFAASVLCSFSGSAEAEILTHTNQFRKSRGMSPLIMNESLNAIAEKHSRNMASGKTAFGHQGFSDRSRQASARIDGVRKFAENVAYGAMSGKEAVKGWKDSPGHRQNMLGKYKYIGIGVAKDKRGRIFYTQVFAG